MFMVMLVVVAAKVPRSVVYRLRRAYPNLSALIRHLLEEEVRKLELSGAGFRMALNGAGQWWTGRDLNPGPPPCEGGVLPG